MFKYLRNVFLTTVPVMIGYLSVGFAFGLLASQSGLTLLKSASMSIFVYAGAMQFILIGLFAAKASLSQIALTTLFVNFRHFFYGFSFIERFQLGKFGRIYKIFALTDETYSLLLSKKDKKSDLLIALFNQTYWIAGTIAGVITGKSLPFSTDGLDFIMTALFTVILVEQWKIKENRKSILIGVFSSVAAILLFGSSSMIIPSLIVITSILLLERSFKTRWKHNE